MKNNYHSTRGSFVPLAFNYFNLFVNKWSVLLLLAIFSFACKKVKEETGLIGKCPEVVSTNPLDTASGVGLNASINATFNEPMSASSITSEAFIIEDDVARQQGTVSYSGLVATFTSTNPLKPNTLYTATIKAGVKDPAGNGMIKDYVWTFTTSAGPDISAPEVFSTDPANLDIKVLPFFNVKVA